MKTALFTILLLCLCQAGFATFPIINTELQAKMNHCGNGDKIKVCILLSEQTDP